MEYAIATQPSGGAMTAGGRDPFAAYGEKAAASKTLLKFVKGRYFAGQDEDEIDAGTRLVASMEGLRQGWLKWTDKRVEQEIMELVSSGRDVPKRHELGDLDKNAWGLDKDGRPQDPWQFTNILGLKNPETGEEYTFTTSSRGGVGAIGRLCKEYGKVYRMKPGHLPVVELQTDSYKHTDYGKMFVPVLKLVDWVKEADLLAGEAAGEDGGDVPWEEEDPKAKTKSRTKF